MQCRKHVGNGAVTFSCTVPIPDGMAEHPGPCEAAELPASQAARRRWQEAEAQREQEALAARETLAQTQSPPMTFADRNPAHTASAVPGSGLSVEEHRKAFQPKVGEFGMMETAAACDHPFDFIMEEPDGALVCRKCVTVVKEPPGAVPAPPVEQVAHEAPPALAPTPTMVGTPIAMPPGLREAMVTEVPDQVPTAAEAVAAFEGEVDAVLEGTHPTVVAVPDLAPTETPGHPGVPVDGPTEPTKQRPGDQPLPTSDPDAPCVQDAIIGMMEESKAIGIERYGQTLHIFNGRDTLKDAHEEARDGLVYLTALSMERAEVLKRFERIASWSMMGLKLTDEIQGDIDFILAWLRGEPTP